jgi:hypothetical protein
MLTSERVYQVLGHPEKEKDMVVWDVPSELELGVIPKKIYCNTRMIIPLRDAFTAILQNDLLEELKTWDGCFNIRQKRGATSWSLHSWGLAIDINAAWNRFGEVPTMSDDLVHCFTSNGFDWGGEWTKPDGMHFQLKSSLFS